jgi:para-aminobenzoate synthetase/4-amino-4-deoxychorismate lyase
VDDFQLLETMRWTRQKGIALLDRHLERMEASARHFGFSFDETAARNVVELVVEDEEEAAAAVYRVRLLLDRHGVFRAESDPLESGGGTVDRTTRSGPQKQGGTEPVPRVGLAPTPVDREDIFLYHKTTRRRVYERARAARPDLDDVLLWNEAGEVTESCVANLVVEYSGENLTPPLSCGLLPGTLRAEMLEQGMLTERVITRPDLLRADAIYLVSALRGLRRVRFVPE